MNQVQLLLKATRARTLPVMVVPVIIGAVLAWQQGFSFQWGLFLLTFVGALAAHLGANVINDVFDFSEGTDQAAQQLMPQGTTLATGSQELMSGTMSLKAFRGRCYCAVRDSIALWHHHRLCATLGARLRRRRFPAGLFLCRAAITTGLYWQRSR